MMVEKERVEKYLRDIYHQVKDLDILIASVPDEKFLSDPKSFTVVKAIKYSMLIAIEDIIHISAHIIATLGLKRPVSASQMIKMLSYENILPEDFANEVSRMVNFRNKLAHEYLPDEFESERLFENIQKTDDFKKFAAYIEKYLENTQKTE